MPKLVQLLCHPMIAFIAIVLAIALMGLGLLMFKPLLYISLLCLLYAIIGIVVFSYYAIRR